MAKHTPGPWKIGDCKADNNRFLAVWQDPHTTNPICLVSPKGDERDHDLANARLIAAAPELLEALKEVLPAFKSCIAGGNGELEGDKGMIARARAAIAKATGA